MRNNSLHRQFLKRLLWPLIIIFLLGSLFAYYFALNTAINTYDLGLLDDGLDVTKQVQINQGKLEINLPPVARQMLQTKYEDRVSYAAWDAYGNLFAGMPELLIPFSLDPDKNYVFQDAVLNGEANRILLLRGTVEGRIYYIAVAQTLRGRNHLTGGIFASILIPEALLALVSIAIILLGIRRGLLPVEALRDEIASRSSNDLRPIEENSAPAELAPIIHGINELLANLAAAFAGHRRFIADAAHQLRTPLASLSGQIELALDSPTADIQKLLRQLLSTSQRTTHLANQLLSLARLEHTEDAMYEVSMVDLQAVIRAGAADFVTLAARKGVELEFDLHPAQVKGSALMLRELFVNLLDNAVRYTPAGGRVKVSILTTNGGINLIVADNGPGVSEAELNVLGKPFHRLSSDNPEGCGLGLAIVREIVRLHGASLMFGTGQDGMGLLASVRLVSETGLKPVEDVPH
jgi:two-component system sensor histidine kinase TctE